MRNDASTSASPTGALRAARDLLLAYRTDYAAAAAVFSWPVLDEFNWALDWFDVIAAEHPDRLALRVVVDDGSDEALSYAEMAARSAQVANWLRGLGVRRGDHVLLMLGNIVPLWEIMLAAMKRIRRVEFGDLPKTISGKIRRVELRAQETDAREGRGVTEFREEDFTW